MSLKKTTLTCPYCWEEIEISVDPAMEGQSYGEDCSVCCRAIVLTVHSEGDETDPEVYARKENE
ncbi:MAG: CPXCG motif-containing cysteine-rich protein [Elusimicrobia bacterium]|nr:CPXCG motif-containing cysteine-rich protein [Elusimicrobiota bacterium]